MAKKIVKSWTVLCDLIDHLVEYGDTLQELPYDAEPIPEEERKRVVRKFPLNTPQEKADAIITIIFGEETIEKRRGNRSFETNDRKLMFQLKAEMKATGLPRETFIDKYAEMAQKRNNDTEYDSVRERLISVYQSLSKTNPEDFDYGNDTGVGFEDVYEEELTVIRRWLSKYDNGRPVN